MLEAGLIGLMRVSRVVHGEAALFAGHDLVHHLVAATATGGRAAMVANFCDAAGAAAADSTTDITIGEGVAVTDEHRSSTEDNLLIVKINFNFTQLARIKKCQ